MKCKVLIVLILATFVFGLECKAQYNGDKAILYGTIRTDGHQKATKGAFWKVRPEAKLIYEGGRPPGYTVYVLDRPSFVRYIEHNNSDINYIVFEVGSVVYTDSNGQFYDAYCGNKIEFIGPVERFIVQEREKIVVQQQPVDDWRNYRAPKKDNVITQLPVPVPIIPCCEKKKSWFARNCCWVVPAGIAIISGSYLIYDNNRPHKSPATEIRSMPGGIPAAPTPSSPGLPSDPRSMPPGTGYVPHTNLGGGIPIFRF